MANCFIKTWKTYIPLQDMKLFFLPQNIWRQSLQEEYIIHLYGKEKCKSCNMFKKQILLCLTTVALVEWILMVPSDTSWLRDTEKGASRNKHY